MKEKEFKKAVSKLDLDYLHEELKIEIPIYYILNDKEEVIVDIPSMMEEFNNKCRSLQELE